MKWLDTVDKQLFTFIHHGLANGFFDVAMPFLRNPLTWIPLYAFLLFWLLRYHIKYAIKFILLSVATVGFTDYVAASVIKPLVGRLRPCHAPDLQPIIRHVVDCGGQLSFPSNHASNHFGMAAFWFFAILSMTGKKWYWLWFWAALICFAQVYVGVHYPFDVTAGAIFGSAAGVSSAWIFKKWARPATENVAVQVTETKDIIDKK